MIFRQFLGPICRKPRLPEVTLTITISSAVLSYTFDVVNLLRACSHDPRPTHCPGKLTDPGVNFSSMHDLTPVTVHMSFSLPRDHFERRVTRCTTPGNPPCRGNFSPCEQNAKVARGKSSLVHTHY